MEPTAEASGVSVLYHHRIPIYLIGRHGDINCWQLRAPTQKEAAEIYGIRQRTICGWVQMQETIESRGSGTLRTQISHAVVNCQWPELESKLYHLFLERREEGQAIHTSWFRTHSFLFFREVYSNASEDTCSTVFRFSNGWFRGFLERFRISLRCITKKAQRMPEDYRQLVINWLQFNRRNCQPSNWLETVLY